MAAGIIFFPHHMLFSVAAVSAVPLAETRQEGGTLQVQPPLPCDFLQPTMKLSLRFWFLSTAFLFIFIMSLLFTYSHHSIAYLDLSGLSGIHRVKLVPGYAGMQRLGKGTLVVKTCPCHRCLVDVGDSMWFDSRYDSNISPVWTKENMDLPLDVQRWWMVSLGEDAPLKFPLGGEYVPCLKSLLEETKLMGFDLFLQGGLE